MSSPYLSLDLTDVVLLPGTLTDSRHLFSRVPPNSYVAIVPNIVRKKVNKMKTSNIVGRELNNAWTNFFILGIELIVLKGLSILMTLIAETLLVVIA